MSVLLPSVLRPIFEFKAITSSPPRTTITINGEDVPITWVHVDMHEDGQWHTDLKAVMQLEGDDRFFVKEGYYQSHEGSYWDGYFYEAKPVEKTVIDWEEVK